MIEIIDNFLENPDLIREYALGLKYYAPKISENWLGFRSKTIVDLDDRFASIILDKILNFLNQKVSLKKENTKITSAFHFSPYTSQMLVQNFFDRAKFHVDFDTNYAGLLYLTPNPPKDTGTSFLINSRKQIDVENKYNRLVVYNANICHGPTNFFGEYLNDGRLSFVFFISQKNILNIFNNSSQNIFSLK